MKDTATALKAEATLALPGAQLAVTNFASGIVEASFTEATQTLNKAITDAQGPELEYNALKRIRDAKLDAMRASF